MLRAGEKGVPYVKIGIMVPRIHVMPGFEDVVSAHIQLPLNTARLIADQGHDVSIVTTGPGEGQVLPTVAPKEIRVLTVTDAMSGSLEGYAKTGNRPGSSVLASFKQVYDLRKLASSEAFDVLHLFGGFRASILGGLVVASRIPSRIALTIDTTYSAKAYWTASKLIWKRLPVVITSTPFSRNRLRAFGVQAQVIEPGVARDLRIKQPAGASPRRHRVVYWRDPSVENGADVCEEVYRRLAPDFQEVEFDVAVRPHPHAVTGLKALAQSQQNVEYFEYPYPASISLQSLLAEAICVLLPFRRMNTHPQLAIIESMFADRAVVTTRIGSNVDLIESGRTGYLVPPGDVDATVRAVRVLLEDPSESERIGRLAGEHIRATWNWESYTARILEMYAQLARN